MHLKVMFDLFAKHEVAPQRALDIGCGNGWLTLALKNRGIETAGLDTQSPTAKKTDQPPWFHQGSAENLPFDDNSFDLAIFGQSLHHVPIGAMGAALLEAQRTLDHGGWLYVFEPDLRGPSFELDRLIDDETDVRLAALKALKDAPGIRFVEEQHYDVPYKYRDAEQFIDMMVTVDPQRKSIAQTNRTRIEEKFEALGQPTDDGRRRFDQPTTAMLFKRT